VETLGAFFMPVREKYGNSFLNFENKPESEEWKTACDEP
jgi:hypothetical protein